MSYQDLPRNTNQALGIAEYAIEFMKSGTPSAGIGSHCVVSCRCVLMWPVSFGDEHQRPKVLRQEALTYPAGGATVFGDATRFARESHLGQLFAVREWDSNGTNFGYRPELGHTAGEFGHNDFYAVPVAAAQVMGLDGAAALRGMVLHDEIRGRLAEVFSLKTYKIDHVVHGAIASAAVWGAMSGASAEQIESAMAWSSPTSFLGVPSAPGSNFLIPKRLRRDQYRGGHYGHASIHGWFLGPKDIFRNPESMFRQFEPTDGDSPFDLRLSLSGDDFAVMACTSSWGSMSTNLREPCKAWWTCCGPIQSCWWLGTSRASRSWRTNQPLESLAIPPSVTLAPASPLTTPWSSSCHGCCNGRLISVKYRPETMMLGAN